MVIQPVAILVSIAAFVWSFFEPAWAWLPMAVLAAILLFTLMSLRSKKWAYVAELSPMANEMLQNHGHFYAMPFAGSAFSGACSMTLMGAMGIGLVGMLKGFWPAIGFAAVFWLALAPAAMAFNPTTFIQKQPEKRMAHMEVLEWIRSQQNK